MNRDETLSQIVKMIVSGEIPKEIYNKYLSMTPIGFMNYDDLLSYLKRENQELKKQLEAKNIQQKEFIDLLEGMYFETDDNWWFAILNKYKEIIGSDK